MAWARQRIEASPLGHGKSRGGGDRIKPAARAAGSAIGNQQKAPPGGDRLPTCVAPNRGSRKDRVRRNLRLAPQAICARRCRGFGGRLNVAKTFPKPELRSRSLLHLAWARQRIAASPLGRGKSRGGGDRIKPAARAAGSAIGNQQKAPEVALSIFSCWNDCSDVCRSAAAFRSSSLMMRQLTFRSPTE